jgi:hypothetical protein
MRRILLLVVLSSLFANSFGQYHLSPNTLDPPRQINSNAEVRFRCSSASVAVPLYVIDGSVSDSSALKFLNPKDILRIDILKGVKATEIYGYRAKDGVIIISTKRREYLIVEDEDDHLLLEGATVKVLSGDKMQDSLLFIADKNGKIDLYGLSDETNYQAEVSCIGYKTKTVIIAKNQYNCVGLKKDYKLMTNVLVVGSSRERKVVCIYDLASCRCSCSFKGSPINAQTKIADLNAFLIYPNPVMRLSVIKIKLLQLTKGKIEVINSAGQIMQSINLNNEKTLDINLDDASAGVYFVCLTDVRTQKRSTQKLIIQ